MKRVGLIVGLALAVFAAVGFAVFLYLSRDIPPPDTSDLVVERPDVADEANAFTYFEAAGEVLFYPEDSTLIQRYLAGEPVDEQTVHRIIERNEETFQWIDKGLACEVCLAPRTSLEDDQPYLYDWRHMAEVLAVRAREERLDGRHEQATDTCILLLRFTALIQGNPVSLVDCMVSLAALHMGTDQAIGLARDEEITKPQLQRLNQALVRVPLLDQVLIRAMQAEYRVSASFIDDLVAGKVRTKEFWGKRFRPGYRFQPNKTKAMLADICRDIIRNASLPCGDIDLSVAEGIARVPPEEYLLPSANTVGMTQCALTFPAWREYLKAKCSAECALAASRLVCACNLYARDHDTLPERLDELVPDYIDAVPRDPYDGEPFRYDRANRTVYSVGKDLEDAGGSPQLLPLGEGRYGMRNRWVTKDAVYGIFEPVELIEPENAQDMDQSNEELSPQMQEAVDRAVQDAMQELNP